MWFTQLPVSHTPSAEEGDSVADQTSCQGRCGAELADCWCDGGCAARGDCCQDFFELCLGAADAGVGRVAGKGSAPSSPSSPPGGGWAAPAAPAAPAGKGPGNTVPNTNANGNTKANGNGKGSGQQQEDDDDQQLPLGPAVLPVVATAPGASCLGMCGG